MLICEDERGIIRDIYFPFVGLENHCNLIRAGIYDLDSGEFSWLDGWRIEQSYKSRFPESFFDDLDEHSGTPESGEAYSGSRTCSNIGETAFREARLGLKVVVREAIHPSLNYLLRVFEVENQSVHPRNLRLFSTHNYSILENKIGETAVVDGDVLIHYKRDRYFLHGSSPAFDQFAVGVAEWKGLEGTWRDLEEDGRLSGNVVSHGSIDSTLAWTVEGLKPGHFARIFFWMAVGKSYRSVIRHHRNIAGAYPSRLFRQSFNFWNSFIVRMATLPECRHLKELPSSVRDIFYRSLLATVAHMDVGGSAIASCDSDIKQFGADLYTYCWPRDAAWACLALDKARYHHLSAQAFEFLSRAVTGKGCLLHKYTPAGDFGSTWHPFPMIQIDETALPLYALYHNWLVSKDVWIAGRYFSSLVLPAGNYLVRSIDEASGLPVSSFDLWEERKGVHLYSACTVYAGLMGASELARVLGDYDRRELWERAAQTVRKAVSGLYNDQLGRFQRSLSDPALDASLFAVWYFGVLPADDPRVRDTMSAVERELTRPSGGLCRYSQDCYQGLMNAWIICTLWLAQWHISLGRLDRALALISWCAGHAHPTGLLPEQVADDGSFRSVLPLMWSHAAFVLAVLEYLQALERQQQA
ncbi:MAG: glycoside hydrolase family 15 protein [Methanotrichaceae archaeon]|nr:glycoside hydrolase family 15 protein [Methanotrichaceae archaeon]